MSKCGAFNFCGLQAMLDSQMAMMQAGLPTWIRYRNFEDVQQEEAIQLGFTLTPDAGGKGTTDLLIQPQPGIKPVSMHSIGMSMGKLRMGAKEFKISQTFVEQEKKRLGLAEWRLVWEGPHVVGLVTENMLYSIESIKHVDFGGQPYLWTLMCNNVEVRVGASR